MAVKCKTDYPRIVNSDSYHICEKEFLVTADWI